MKKSILSVAVLAAFLVTACGPSAQEVEKKRQDSIHAADSIAAIAAAAEAEAMRVQDSIAAATAAAEAQAKHAADSIAAAEAAAKSKPASKPKTAVEKKTEEVKKATKGKG